MQILKKLLIFLFAAFIILTGIIALNHFHSESVFKCGDKDHCSICAYLFTINNTTLNLFFFAVIFSALSEQIVKYTVIFVINKFVFLPPSLAPPIVVV